MESALTIYNQNGKVLQETKVATAVYNPKTDKAPHTEIVKVIKEKVLVLNFNNGNKVEKIIITNLAEQRGNQTKEQLLNQRIIEGKGHIMLTDNGNNRIIRVSNIISVDTQWRNVIQNP